MGNCITEHDGELYFGNVRIRLVETIDHTTTLLTERGKTHGDYTVHASITQFLKSVMHDTEGWARLSLTQKETLEMIAHKIGRVLAGDPNFRDHWMDISGYAKLQADRSHEP